MLVSENVMILLMDENPVNNGIKWINSLSTGVGFWLSTVFCCKITPHLPPTELSNTAIGHGIVSNQVIQTTRLCSRQKRIKVQDLPVLDVF